MRLCVRETDVMLHFELYFGMLRHWYQDSVVSIVMRLQDGHPWNYLFPGRAKTFIFCSLSNPVTGFIHPLI